MADSNVIQLAPALNYLHNVQHRNRTRLKSQWTIDRTQERACFLNSHNSGWLEDNTGWGLHLHDRVVDYLGLSHDSARRLFIAKFVENHHPPYWHGYPADCRENTYDIPKEHILKKWLDDEILSRANVRKILKQQECRI